MVDNFDVDEHTEVPSQKEIAETLRSKKNVSKRNIIVKTTSSPSHLKRYIIIATIVILVLGGAYFIYNLLTAESASVTGNTVRLSGISSAITGFFVEGNLPPEEERFGIKITGKEIDISEEEKALQSNIKTNYTTKCTQEKLEVKNVAEAKMEKICNTTITNMQKDIDSWKEKYTICNERDND